MKLPLPLPAHLESRIVLALIVLFFASSWLMATLGAPLIGEYSPSGIVDFELAGSGARAAGILASWDESARAAARTQTFWDYFLYIPVYVLMLAAWSGWCARRLQTRWLADLGVALAWLAPLAGLLDVVENLQLMWQLEHGAEQGRAALAATSATIKFGIAFAAGGYALVATLIIALQRRRAARAGA